MLRQDALEKWCQVRFFKGTSYRWAFFVDYRPPESDGIAEVQVGSGSTTAVLRLLPDDTTIDLTIYVDNTFAEAFWMGGRVAMTVVTKTSGGHDDVAVSASHPGITASADAWQVGSIWVTPDEVRRTPRRDASVEDLA